MLVPFLPHQLLSQVAPPAHQDVPKRWNVQQLSHEPRATVGCFFYSRGPRAAMGRLRQTNKGAERGHGIPSEWRNPTWVEVSGGQTFSGDVDGVSSG